jgi:hypothetical protein
MLARSDTPINRLKMPKNVFNLFPLSGSFSMGAVSAVRTALPLATTTVSVFLSAMLESKLDQLSGGEERIRERIYWPIDSGDFDLEILKVRGEVI